MDRTEAKGAAVTMITGVETAVTTIGGGEFRFHTNQSGSVIMRKPRLLSDEAFALLRP
jgi:hypothetical protein